MWWENGSTSKRTRNEEKIIYYGIRERFENFSLSISPKNIHYTDDQDFSQILIWAVGFCLWIVMKAQCWVVRDDLRLTSDQHQHHHGSSKTCLSALLALGNNKTLGQSQLFLQISDQRLQALLYFNHFCSDIDNNLFMRTSMSGESMKHCHLTTTF